MYTSTILLFFVYVISAWFVLFVSCFLLYPVIVVKRIRNEEEVLEKSLADYSEYKQRIKYRLIPYIW